MQIEGGFSFERETRASEPNTSAFSIPDGLLRVGILPSFEARLAADGLVIEERSGDNDRTSRSDLSLGARLRAFDQRGIRPATALDFNLSLPTGSDAVTSDGVDPSGALLFEWRLSERFSLDVNLGLASTSLGKGSSRRAFEVAPTASLNVSISQRAGAFFEYYASLADSGVDDEHSLDAGVSWLATDNLQLDASAGAGLNAAAPDFFVSAGAAWRFWLPGTRERP